MIFYMSSIEIEPISRLVFMTLSVIDVMKSESTIHADPIDTQHTKPICYKMPR